MPYISACKEDCCASQGGDCVCSSFEAYSRACMDANIQLTWRSDQLCRKLPLIKFPLIYIELANKHCSVNPLLDCNAF